MMGQEPGSRAAFGRRFGRASLALLHLLVPPESACGSLVGVRLG